MFDSKTGMEDVTLAFLPAGSPLLEEHWMNTAARKLSEWRGLEPYIHIELLVNDKSFSITANAGQVHCCPNKEFNRDEWKFVRLEVTPEKKRLMLNYAMRAHAAKCGFNWKGYAATAVGSSYSGGGKNFFCSEFVASALQAGGFTLKYRPEQYIPAALYKEVEGWSASLNTWHPKLNSQPVHFEF